MVIAILSILAALLLPALARAKGQARRLQCLNNEKQLTAVWMMYIADNNDWLVSNGGYPAAPPRRAADALTSPRLWVQGAFVLPRVNTNSQYLLDPQYAAFADYVNDLRSFVCPADPPSVEVCADTYPRVRSYALNAYLGWVGPWDPRLSAHHRVFWKQCQMTALSSADTFLFQDVQPDSICFPFFGVFMQIESFYNFPSSAHGQRGNISFADGHVETRRWRDARTLEAFSTAYHRHDDPSPDNADLAWLRERTTVKR